MNGRHHVEVKQDASGGYYWARFAANGEQVSKSSESYINKAHAVEQALELNGDVSDIRVADGE